MPDKKISLLSSDTAPSLNDLIVTVDIESGSTKKATLADLATTIGPSIDNLPAGSVKDSNIDWTTVTGVIHDTEKTDQAAVSLSNATIRRYGPFLWVKINIQLGTALNDITTDLVQLNLAPMGITTLLNTTVTAYADGANTISMIDILPDGMIRSRGSEPLDIPVGGVIEFSHTIPITGWV